MFRFVGIVDGLLDLEAAAGVFRRAGHKAVAVDAFREIGHLGRETVAGGHEFEHFLADGIAADGEKLHNLRFFPNPRIHEIADDRADGAVDFHVFVAVGPTDVTPAVAQAADGAGLEAEERQRRVFDMRHR